MNKQKVVFGEQKTDFGEQRAVFGKRNLDPILR